MRTTPYYIYARVRSVLRMPLLSVLLFLFSSLPSDVVSQDFGLFTQSAPCPKRELRAVWVTTLNGLDWPKTHATSAASRAKQQQELCQLLDQLKAININTVLLQTRVRGSVIYPSAIEPWDVALTGTYGGDPGYDPLEFAIQETHRRGMELHAWVVTIPCFKVAVAPKMGSRSVLKTHPELCRRHSDTYYLDPGLPGSADYLQRICHEIVSRYDVDGIHFDYIRYPEGASSFNDGETFRKYGSRGQTKAAWRRNNITRIVRRIYNDVHQLKPWVRVSSSPVGKYADVTRFSSRGWNARDAVHQDAQGWLRQGIHDILFPMMYFDGDHFYPFAADWQEQKFGRNVAPGLGIYFLHPQEKNWPLEVIIRQLHYLRSQELDGQAYFRSKFLTDNVKGLYKYLQQDFYAFPALPPACPWLSTSLPPAPAELSVEPCSGFSELRWQAPADNLRYNVYASSTWPVDVTSAQNMIAVLLPEPHFVFSPLQMAFSHLHLAVTSMDRFGNESIATQLSASPDAIPSPKLFDSRGRMKDFIHRPMTTAEQKERNQGKTKRK